MSYMLNNNDESDNSSTLIYASIIIIMIAIAILGLFFFKQDKNTTADLDLTSQQLVEKDSTSPTTAVIKSNTNTDQNINQTETQPPMNKTNLTRPEMTIDPNKEYIATMNTSEGVVKIKLFAQETPVTVNNFVYLAQNKFYDGLIFHRVIKDFMIQGGCPLGNGTGGPGYKFEDEQNSAPLVQGSLAMANSGPDTNGSQFFIVTAAATPWLDGVHTHFGQVIEGMDVIMKIDTTPTGSNDKPTQNITINSVTISEN